jgi:hypothetical protein
MDAGPRSGEIAASFSWQRGLLAWMLIMLAETGSGAIREIFIAPVIGDLRARQLGVFIGCLLIFSIALATARWIHAATRRQQFAVGALWVVLTLAFEFAIGRATGASWSRILSDYDPSRGGLMLLGMAFMFLAPMLAARLRFQETTP